MALGAEQGELYLPWAALLGRGRLACLRRGSHHPVAQGCGPGTGVLEKCLQPDPQRRGMPGGPKLSDLVAGRLSVMSGSHERTVCGTGAIQFKHVEPHGP